MTGKYLAVAFGDNPVTPGRFLVDGFKRIGQPLAIFHYEIDFSKIDLSACAAVLFIDCPSRPPVGVTNLGLAKKNPKFFWTYHGKHVLFHNMALAKEYTVDGVLMSSCLQLSSKFAVPVHFFPLAVPDGIFKGGPPLNRREIQISFVGNTKGGLYAARKESLQRISKAFPNFKTVFTKRVCLEGLASLYANSIIVYNDSINQTITLRIFEGIGARALVLSDSPPAQDLCLTPNQHFIHYRTETEKLNKIRYYLHNLDEAQLIAERGFNWVMKHHTFSIRAAQFLALLERYC